ncbi:uncharacterized protein An13g00630 [Aspergillus niger]|uniref:Contig An13c0030, genomic contig n=2 Tax=Aspergillus niger TaxID=5061 RepID=A2R1B4_ASPNC|nr:uncharacterized protein An13g00630 [Aspergillus niger]CAK41464.1 unnamed protein product [Aspergillus niger]
MAPCECKCCSGSCNSCSCSNCKYGCPKETNDGSTTIALSKSTHCNTIFTMTTTTSFPVILASPRLA